MNINIQDLKGNSTLHWAAYSNSLKAVDYLIYYKIDINLTYKDDETALDLALRKQNFSLVKKFKEDYKPSKESKLNQDKTEIIKDKSGFTTKLNSLLNQILGKENPNISFAYPFLFFIMVVELFNQIIIIRGYKNYFMAMVLAILFSVLLFFNLTASKSDAGEILSKCINSLIRLALFLI